MIPALFRTLRIWRCVAVLRVVGGHLCLLTAFGVSMVALCGNQADAQSNGALFLLVPFGGRAVGLGGAVVADTALGTEGMWWNAASMARLRKKELAIHHSQTAFANSNMIAVALPSRVLGTIAGSAYIVDYGALPVTIGSGETSIGTIANYNYQFALSYASPIGKHFNAGLTGKFLMLRFNQCSGICTDIPLVTGNTFALDAGAQYTVAARIPFTIGAALRNLGPALQAKDRDQADPLPRVAQIGVKALVPIAAFSEAGASLELSGDVQYAAAFDGTTAALGASVGYRDMFFLRGGYKRQSQGGGPSFGFGLERGAFGLDFARIVESSALGDSPTYVSLRVRF